MHLPDVRVLYNRLKSSAKKRNIEFKLSVTDMYHIDYPLTCPILGIRMAFNRINVQDNSYSVDRIDNTIGYQLDNIQMLTLQFEEATKQFDKIKSGSLKAFEKE